jgi:hypothetical protein
MALDELAIGTFTYSTADVYIVRPDGSFVISTKVKDKDTAYHYVPTIGQDGKPKTDDQGNQVTHKELKPDYHVETVKETEYILQNGSHVATDSEVATWAYKVAAKNGGISSILAVRSVTNTRNANYMGVVVIYQDVTIMAYGKRVENAKSVN